MRSKGISIPMKSIYEGTNAEELIKIGGKRQVPCLIIDGKPLYESDDIITWLDKNYQT
jgi:glutathione S-transferase